MDGFSWDIWCKINSLFFVKNNNNNNNNKIKVDKKNSANSFVLKAKLIFAHHICYEGQNAPS